ncbi:MAG: MgtC/SapB family protein [Firmicutes bacterium]|nr:MgtC/SapB family protein [Bacillota bacterium]
MALVEILLRLLVAFFLGGLVGLEREIHGRPAGLRTHILVAFGSALTMIVSMYAFAGLNINYDPGRIAAQVVSGIGFLGAGTILRDGLSIKGLTTAASLWMVAAIGLAAGAGMHLIAIISALMALVVLYVLHPLETKFEASRPDNELEVVVNSVDCFAAVLDLMRKYQGKLTKLELGANGLSLKLSFKSPNIELTARILEDFAQLERARRHSSSGAGS